MPVVIVGSGRCGTSMVVRMLDLCGLNIGKSGAMSGPADSCNQTGYWEHRAFVDVNNEILSHYGGSDLLPPVFPLDWQFDDSLNQITIHARKAIEDLSRSGAPWGWKDPRTSLTLPFWKRLIPDLKVIVCVRNPLDVALSYKGLIESYGSTNVHLGTIEGLIKWHTYNASVIEHTCEQCRLFTFYEDYFPDFHAPLSQLLDFTGLEQVELGSVTDRRLEVLHDPSLKHHHSTTQDLLTNPIAPERVKQLYVEILNAATDPAAAEATLRAAAFSESPLPAIDISQYDPARIQQIIRENILLEVRNRELEQMMSTRAHRIASQMRNLMIFNHRLIKLLKNTVSDKYNDIIAMLGKEDKSRPLRWY